MKYKVITLCGSTKFKNEFEKIQKELTLKGNIVISVGCFNHSGDVVTKEQENMLKAMHRQKIDMSDEIFVINVDGYIGENTKSEIEYAEKNNKIVNYLIPCSEQLKSKVVNGKDIEMKEYYEDDRIVISEEIRKMSPTERRKEISRIENEVKPKNSIPDN